MRNFFRKIFSRKRKNNSPSDNPEFTGDLSYLNDIPKLDIIGSIDLSDIIGSTITDIKQEFSFNKIDNWMDYSRTFITLNDDLVITFPVTGSPSTSIVRTSKQSKNLHKQYTTRIIGQQINDFYFYYFENYPDSNQPSYMLLSNGFAMSEESIGIHGTGNADLHLYSEEQFQQIIHDKEADIRSFLKTIDN